MKQYILTLTAILLVFTLQAQSNFNFTPTNSSATFIGQAQINGFQLTSNDTIAVFDSSGNCCGIAALIDFSGNAYINLVIYGDDVTTPTIDEGMNGNENFFLHLYDSSDDTILIYKSIDSLVSFTGWSNTNGAPLTQYNDPNMIYDFTFSIYGCTDPVAVNYDSFANTDDGNCCYDGDLCLGSFYYGGKIFYLDGNGGGLIAAESAITDTVKWGCLGQEITGADGTGVGSGYQNTLDILSECTTVGIAADICNNLTLNGFNDWFLPSIDELTEINNSLFAMSYSGSFWSSSEIDSAYSFKQNIPSGMIWNTSKFQANKVIPIRSFLIGCTDPLASNYNVNANIDNGFCIINGCTDPLAFNYDANANTDDGSCIAVALGCTDPLAFNYDATANTDDGSCIAVALGCTDPLAFNYDSNANTDDGSCIAVASGCTDPLAFNYDATANTDDGSCIAVALGCTDPLASNYDSNANTDDGSCIYSTVCSEPTPTGLFTSNIVHNRATINWDNMNDANCTVDQYRIKYREVGTNSWSQKNMCTPLGSCTWACNKTDKLILGLNPGTTYEYQIRAWYCGAGNSAWSSLNTFTTLDACPNVGNLTVSTPNTTKATFNWDASNGVYEFVRIKSRVDSISNPSNADWFNIGGAGVSYPTLTKNKNNLTPGETYRAQARTWCDPNGGAYKSDTWTPLVYWTQPTPRIEGGESIANLEVYPNPSNDVFNISFTSESIQDLRVRVLSIIGEELIVEDLQQFIGEYTKKVSLNENAKGIYFLEIKTKDGIINKKLILQ